MTFSSDKDVKRHAMGFLLALKKDKPIKLEHLYVSNEKPKVEEDERAFKTAKGCYEGIAEQFALIDKAIEAKDDKQQESLEEELDGYSYGQQVLKHFELTLAGGGPACRIYGELDEHNQPYNCEIQYQDWGTPWTEYRPAEPALLERFAQRFYFGE